MPAKPSNSRNLPETKTADAQKSLRPAQRNPFRSFVSTAQPGEELANARRLPLDLIDINPRQARQQFDEDALEELASSIREHDVLQPIGVVRTDDRYRIVFGERRYRASLAANKSDIPAVIYENLSEEDAAILTALENLQREDLDLEDEARQFAYLLDVTGLSQRALAERLGKTHNYISRRVRLLREHPELFAVLRQGLLTQREALSDIAGEHEVYHGDTAVLSSADLPGSHERQVGVYHGDTLVSVISINREDGSGSRTPRSEMSSANAGYPARWHAISRTYRVLGKIQPQDVPLEECADLANQLEGLEVLVAATRRAIQLRLENSGNPESVQGMDEGGNGDITGRMADKQVEATEDNASPN